MEKDEALKKFVDTIYNKNSKVIFSKQEIKKIEEFYKNNYKVDLDDFDLEDIDYEKLKQLYKDSIKLDEEFNKFLEKELLIKKMIEQSKSAWSEIRKQFKAQKALQSGIISECFYASTIAKIFNLNKFVDLESCLFNEVPPECIDYITSTTIKFNCARYLYYNKSNLDVFIIQYGNPAHGDAEIIINGQKIRLEFKEQKAKAGEYDIHYNENGNLILAEDFGEKFPELSKLIHEFNNNTNLMENVGHNYKELDKELGLRHVKRYFENNAIDVLISTNVDNDLLTVTSSCLDDEKIISTRGSEIRTAGRNSKSIFTPNYFEEVMNEIGADKINENMYKVLKEKITITSGRGQSEPSRLKLNPLFFVKVSDLIEEGEHYIINKDNIKQILPTISIHIEIIAKPEEIKTIIDNDFV